MEQYGDAQDIIKRKSFGEEAWGSLGSQEKTSLIQHVLCISVGPMIREVIKWSQNCNIPIESKPRSYCFKMYIAFD